MKVRRDGVVETQQGVPNETGAWGYKAGASGTPAIPAGARVLGIAAHATTAGSMTINAGDSIPVPANSAIEFAPRGNLTAPTIVLTGTDSYLIEYVT